MDFTSPDGTALPCTPSFFHARPDLGVPGARPSRWVTREKPKVERIACPWLIRRFIDPRAEFFFVPDADVTELPHIGHYPQVEAPEAVLAAYLQFRDRIGA